MAKIIKLRVPKQALQRLVDEQQKKLQKTISGRITKTAASKPTKAATSTMITAVKRQRTATSTPVRRRKRSLMVVLRNVQYSKLDEEIQEQDFRILFHQQRLENTKSRYFAPPPGQCQNRYGFAFGHNPFEHRAFKGPIKRRQWHVYELMRDDLLANFNKECFLDQPDASTNSLQDGPMHMSDDLTVDNLVKVILSISTENSLAIRQHAQLCSKFTYTVDGKEVKGTVPNYHKMRICSPDELIRALNIAGHHNMRQKAFHSILDEVYQQNLRRLPPGAQILDGNPTGARDFVPGMLSMEYLKGNGLSKQERFDLLVKFEQIAVKTGCCLLAFNLKIPIFVVDTHVHNMVRHLKWIPEDCFDADRACMFLDNIIDEKLKFGLHQAFWHHRINCARCMPRANPESQAYKDRICPLEQIIDRKMPTLTKAIIASKKVQTVQKRRTKTVETDVIRKLPGSVTFLNIHYKVAEERGYALRKVEIDDDFGDGARQNKDVVANYYWGQKEFTHANDIVKFEDALEAVGMAKEEYEARFVKKTRIRKTTNINAENAETAEHSTSTDQDNAENAENAENGENVEQ